MNTRNYIYLFTSLWLCISCIKEDMKPCPHLQLNIEIKDKNYFNINNIELEEHKGENLPFKEYIPTLHYTLYDFNTGNIVEQKNVFNVSGDEKTFQITFPENMPLGKYVFTVWGGLADETALKDDPEKATLHVGNKEGNDLYLSNDTLIYNVDNYHYTINMERTKGKLIVQLVNLPHAIVHSENSIDSLFKRVDRHFNYSESTSVYNQSDWKTAPETVIKTVLAPSGKDQYSLLRLNFYATAQHDLSALTPKGINIAMRRNELTVLKYVYDDSGDFRIYMLVNDSWEQQHGLVIN